MSSAADATENYTPFDIDDTYYTIKLDRVLCIRPILTCRDAYCKLLVYFLAYCLGYFLGCSFPCLGVVVP